jgi:hypothetical protein
MTEREHYGGARTGILYGIKPLLLSGPALENLK